MFLTRRFDRVSDFTRPGFAAAAIGLGCALSAAPTADADVLDATLLADTYVSAFSTENTTNFSGDSTLNFRTFTSGWRNPLLQFALPVLPTGDKVVKVELIITSASAAAGTGGTPDIEVTGTTTTIDLSTITYNGGLGTFWSGGEAGTSRLLWDTGEWSLFDGDSVIPGADFAAGQTISYDDEDAAGGLLEFVADSISGSSSETVTLGLGFLTREGNDGTTSTGWTLASDEGAGADAILRITTAPIPEPGSLALIAAGGVLMLRRRG